MSHILSRRHNRRRFLQSAGISAVGLTFLPRFALSEEEKKLNFYNFDTYIGETTLGDFNAATGIEVKLDLYADSDELFSKLKAGNPGYDVIVPSDRVVERMIKAEMLMPINKDKIPNIANIDPNFMKPSFDPERKYSLPYMWGTVGIGYRKSKVAGGVVDSWKSLFEDEANAGRIALLGDQEHCLGIALKYLGLPYNSVDPAELAKAKDLLIASKKGVKKYAEDNGQELLAQGEVDLAMEYNGDIAQVMAEDEDIAYVVPNEGSNVWEDDLCIPVGAPHPENAHAFINFLNDPAVGKANAEFIQYATPNAKAKELADEKYRNNSAIFASAEILAKCEYAAYLGEDAAKLRDEIWTAIQAA